MDTQVPEFGKPIRREFMLKEGRVYLNHGAYGAMPRCVHEKQIHYLAELESCPDIWFRKSMYEYVTAAVKKASEFLGTDPNDTFLLQNTTKAVNTVVKSFPLKAGDSLMINTFTYPAVKNTTRHTSRRKEGVNTRYLEIPIPIKSEDEIVEMFDQFLDKHPDIKFAVIDHITSPTSILMPVKRLTEVCHRHDVIVMIDGAHAPGLLDVDFMDIDADFYAGNFHKWVYSPRSCAFLWKNPRRQYAWLSPLITSKFDSQGLCKEFIFEGTKDDTPYICIIQGIDYYNRIGGKKKILNYTTSLQKQGVAYLEEKWGTKRLDVPESFVSPNIQVVELPYIPYYSENPGKCIDLLLLLLEKYMINVLPLDVHGKLMCRIMVQVYNTMEDFERLADVILSLSRERCENK